MTEPNRVGTVELGNFRILGELGRGAQAMAYLAEQLGTERRAVLKIAYAGSDEDLDEIHEQFKLEVRASTRVLHPNLITVFMAGLTHDGRPAIAMEFVPGDPLEHYLQRSTPLSTQELRCLRCVVDGLAALHRGGIVHRDITPSNIIVFRDHSGQLQAKLLDFGIAALQIGNARAVGTPRFAAPEQIQGQALPASDMYAVGSILWWMATGKPYLYEIEDLERVAEHQLLSFDPPDPTLVAPDIAPPLATMISALLHPRAELRPSARQFLHEWDSTLHATKKWRSTLGPSSAAMEAFRKRLRLLVVSPDPVKQYLVRDFCEPLGCDVEIMDDPRKATRGEAGDFEVVVLGMDLDGIDVNSVAKHFPEQRIVLMTGPGETALDPAQVGADQLIHVPGELNHLASYLRSLGEHHLRTDLSMLSVPGSREVLDATVMARWADRPRIFFEDSFARFIGRIPMVLAELETLEPSKDRSLIASLCREIGELSQIFGASHLVRLARSLTMLIDGDAMPDYKSFVKEIENEYTIVFRQLLQRKKSFL